jgi:serine/threonine protein kinase/HAMP domain-containing protein
MRTLGRYTIEGLLGEGAMAHVYRATDPGIGRDVAIKVLKPECGRDPGVAERFLREARAAGVLSHANIATIYEVGEDQGIPYIVMELVEGQPLDQVLQAGGRMPYERVLKLGHQLADALGYAHRAGVVHRDVKPSNILLSSDGKTVKLLDFGVARIGAFEHADDAALARTQVGQVIGTPRYMSPEQALGMPVEARSDLFSLGAVLYEMVTGKTAFSGTGLATLAIQIAQESPEPIERSAADCPPGLRFIIGKLLAKKPEARFDNGEALAQALGREIAEVSAEPKSARRGLPLRVKLPLALFAVTAIALFLSIAAILDRQKDTMEQMAITSGASIAAFVTGNASVLAADNAGLPADQQDWAPLQAFVDTAAKDEGVRTLVVADERGVIRAASEPRLVGLRYRGIAGERILGSAAGAQASAVHDAAGKGIRFVRPIDYAGARFGTIDLVLKRDGLDGAIGNARSLLIALALIVSVVVVIVGYLSGSLVARPIRKLQRALDDAAKTQLGLRISHRRGDELGAVFDSFNRMASALEPQLAGAPREDPAAALATRIAPSPDQRLAA